MEENTENTEVQGQRVTRARTRRMSLLDTDSRPGTPQLDTASDRGTASPRPTRRTRLNSVTLDVRTPTRPTRASLARGETPEPTTPSSVKRTARTPAKTKSVRQQLTLKEEEEVEVKPVEKPSSRTNTPPPAGEKRVTRSMSQTPPSVTRPSSQPDLITFPENNPKRELESVDKPQVLVKEVKAAESIKPYTPKVSVRLEKLKFTEQGRSDMILAEEIKQNARASFINPLVVEGTNDDYKESVPTLDSEKSQVLPSINNESQVSIPSTDPKTAFEFFDASDNTREMQPAPAHLPVRPPGKNDSLEEQEFLDAEESLPEDEPQKDGRVSEMKQNSKGEQQVNTKPDIAEPEAEIMRQESPKRKEAIIELEQGSEVKNQVMPKPQEEIMRQESPKRKEATIELEKGSKVEQQVMPKPDIADPEEEIMLQESPKDKEATIETPEELIAEETKPLETLMDVDEEIDVPDRENSVITLTYPDPFAGPNKKVVGFNSDTEEADVEKKRFPKTPGREKAPSTLSFTPQPLKTDLEQRRNSSTPLLKSQESQLVIGKTELQAPPLQIDAIKPFDELEKEKESSLVRPANMSPKKTMTAILALLNSDEEPEESGGEEEEGDDCEFVDNEAEEAPAHYLSGDSMDSMDRREIEENEIHCDGESVGSQDTEDDSVGDIHESSDSFIVPDDDVEEDLDPLCYSTNEEDEAEHFESMCKKKRRRILVAESSDDENQGKDQNMSQLAKSKDQSNFSSDASKLSEAAQMLNVSTEKTSHSETELENSRIVALNELNKSERFNKTATRLDASVLELDSTDQEEEEDQAEKGNRSVVEIMDSEDDKDPVDDKDEDEGEKHKAAPETKSEMAAEEETVEKSTSFQTQKSSKSADEEALLAELASSDLRHLETMFNPLQKSRRQSLIMPGHELAAKEPKLKRRSTCALVGSPSQSFVNMMAEHKRIMNKRKRLSKSFSGAAEDLEEMGGIHHERKRLKSSRGDSSESLEDDDDPKVEAAVVEHSAEIETSGQDVFQESDNAEGPMQTETIPEAIPDDKMENFSLKKSPAKETLLDSSQSKEQPNLIWEAEAAGDKTIPSIKASSTKGKLEPPSKPRTAEYYLEYCNNVLQKANEALRKKKQEDVAAGKKQKKQKRPAASVAGISEQVMSVLTLQTGKPTSKPALVISTVQAGKQDAKPTPPPPKKDLKRLQAARQAVGHAVNLLAPSKIAGKEPRSLARKLSPQPPIEAKKESKKLKKTKKQKLAETSPLKSSDEENHIVRGNRFRTNAGFVTVSRIDSPPRAPIIELIKTSSGIMRVEPATPKQKYFRDTPATPRNQGFQERPASPGHSKKRVKQKAQNPAMQSALRFKEQAFARKF